MIIGRKSLVVAGIVVVAVASTSCSSDSNASSPSGGDKPSPASAAAQLSTGVDQPGTFTPTQLLAATGGATPVAFAQPAHGHLSYGANGAMVYTPEKGFSGTDEVQVTTADAVKLYAADVPPIATVGGVVIEGSADGSAIAVVPGSTDEIYGLSDRGPNVDGRTDNEKVLPVPDFQPRINRYRLTDGAAAVEKTIGLTGPDGKPLNGLVDPRADTGETLVDMNGAPLPTSDHGLDTEGLVALPDGTFWISDEYGPFLVHFDAGGKELERLSPFDGSLPRELAFRTPNQGMEGLTITPDGSTLVGIMQSALKTPGLEGSAKSVAFTRIVTVDLATKAVAEYLYPLANPQKSKVRFPRSPRSPRPRSWSTSATASSARRRQEDLRRRHRRSHRRRPPRDRARRDLSGRRGRSRRGIGGCAAPAPAAQPGASLQVLFPAGLTPLHRRGEHDRCFALGPGGAQVVDQCFERGRIGDVDLDLVGRVAGHAVAPLIEGSLLTRS